MRVASSSMPTLARMIFCSVVMVSSNAPRRGASPPRPLCARLGSRFAVGTGHLCQIKFWLMQLMQTSWVSPAQACGSPRVALDQRRVSPFSRAMRAITARVGPCAWAGLQAMVATRIFVSGCRRTAGTLSSHAVGVKAISSLSLGSPLVRWPRHPRAPPQMRPEAS